MWARKWRSNRTLVIDEVDRPEWNDLVAKHQRGAWAYLFEKDGHRRLARCTPVAAVSLPLRTRPPRKAASASLGWLTPTESATHGAAKRYRCWLARSSHRRLLGLGGRYLAGASLLVTLAAVTRLAPVAADNRLGGLVASVIEPVKPERAGEGFGLIRIVSSAYALPSGLFALHPERPIEKQLQFSGGLYTGHDQAKAGTRDAIEAVPSDASS